MQTTSLCRKVCWVHTIKQNKQANWEDLYQTVSHFSQCSEALFALTNPVTKGSESQSPADLTLPAASLIPVLEVPPQLQGQLKGPCICSSIAAFHNPAISLYLWWLRALKLCCNWEGAVRQLEKAGKRSRCSFFPTVLCARAPRAMPSMKLPPCAPSANSGPPYWRTACKLFGPEASSTCNS